MSKEAELTTKRARVAALLDAHGLAGLLLGRTGSVSWALAGGTAHTAITSELATAAVLYTPERDFILASQVELPRLVAEALPGLPFEPLALPWYEPDQQAATLAELVAGGRLASDVPLPGAELLPGPIAALRAPLTPEEQARLRDLSTRAGAAMEAAAGEIAPGMSEYAIAGLLGEECYLRDLTPVMLLVGTDERAWSFRHPVPTSKHLERYALLILSARRAGLIASLTRLVHFGAIPADLQRRAEACARIDATLIAATRPDARAGAIFAQAQAAYAAQGFADEWHHHHLGGATGYEDYEWLARPDGPELVHVGQACSWNPSVAGARSADTLLVEGDQTTVLTATPRWPHLAIQVGEQVIERPAILEVD